MFRMIQRAALTSAVGLLGVVGLAGQANAATTTKYLTTIHVVDSTGTTVDPTGIDIAWVDPSRNRFYLADSTNIAIDVVDTRTDQFLGFLGQGYFNKKNAACTGANPTSSRDCNSPKGVVTDSLGRVWAGNAAGSNVGSNVLVLNPQAASRSLAPNPHSVIATIPTGGKIVADEMAYDPQDDVVLVGNPSGPDGFVSWISARTLKVLGTYTFPTSGFAGIEQPVWNPRNDEFYVNVPGASDTGAVDVFSALPGSSPAPLASYPVANCGSGSPNGLVLVGHYFAAACANNLTLLDRNYGSVVAQFSQLAGADEIATDGSNVFVPLGASDQLGVLDPESGNVSLVAAGTGWDRATVAADACNGQVFLATNGVGIEVFAQGQDERHSWGDWRPWAPACGDQDRARHTKR